MIFSFGEKSLIRIFTGAELNSLDDDDVNRLEIVTNDAEISSIKTKNALGIWCKIVVIVSGNWKWFNNINKKQA